MLAPSSASKQKWSNRGADGVGDVVDGSADDAEVDVVVDVVVDGCCILVWGGQMG